MTTHFKKIIQSLKFKDAVHSETLKKTPFVPVPKRCYEETAKASPVSNNVGWLQQPVIATTSTFRIEQSSTSKFTFSSFINTISESESETCLTTKLKSDIRKPLDLQKSKIHSSLDSFEDLQQWRQHFGENQMKANRTPKEIANSYLSKPTKTKENEKFEDEWSKKQNEIFVSASSGCEFGQKSSDCTKKPVLASPPSKNHSSVNDKIVHIISAEKEGAHSPRSLQAKGPKLLKTIKKTSNKTHRNSNRKQHRTPTYFSAKSWFNLDLTEQKMS